MKKFKYSCDYLHHSIYLAPNELRNCCKRFFHKGKMKGDVKILNVDKFEDIDVDRIIQSKNDLLNKINNGVENDCTGCPYLVKRDWDEINQKNFEVKHISVESTSVCSMKCTYCSEMYYGGLKPNYDTNKVLQNLKKYKTKGSDFEFSWGGGEPTLLEDFENIFKNNTNEYKPQKNFVYSNALKYSDQIEKFLKENKVLLITSIDAGTPGMFKQIRGVKGIYKVLKNLKKYFDNSYRPGKLSNIIIKYIVTEQNITTEEIDSFIELIKEYRLEKCSFQISADFKNENLNKNQTINMIEFFIKLKNAGVNLVYFDYHSAPKIRKQVNTLFKINEFTKNKLINNYFESNKISSKKDIVVWGAGDTGRLIKSNNYFIKNKILDIKYYVDRKYKELNNSKSQIKIKPPPTLRNDNYSILIASSSYYEEIYSEIVNLGIKQDRILDQIYC